MKQDFNSQLLSRFLKCRRAAVSPCDHGLAEGERRRTPGLRREEVSMLAGVSVSWYTWLEQGRDISVSANVLERLCDVLHLDADEREYLFRLVHSRPAPLRSPAQEPEYAARPAVWHTLEALTVPALAMTHRWDVIAWNKVMLQFRDYSHLPAESRNLLKLLVTDPIHKQDPEVYEKRVARSAAVLRDEYSGAGEDPALTELVEELISSCSVFERYWYDSNPLARAEAEGVVNHPEMGGLMFHNVAYLPKGEPHVRVVIFLPGDEISAREIARLNEQAVGGNDVGEAVWA